MTDTSTSEDIDQELRLLASQEKINGHGDAFADTDLLWGR